MLTPLVADTGATAHFLQNPKLEQNFIHTSIPVSNLTPTSSGIHVMLPNNETMQATHTATLNIPHLPIAARQAHIFPALASGSLLSIGQLCDHGCSAYFDNKKLYILHNGRIIMQGTRDKTKLWTIDNPPSTTHSLNSIIDAPTIAERIKFYTASLFSPTLSSLPKPCQQASSPLFLSSQLNNYASSPHNP